MNIQIRTLSSLLFMTLALRFKFHCAEVAHSYFIFPLLSKILYEATKEA